MTAPLIIATDYAETSVTGTSLTLTFSNIVPVTGDVLLVLTNLDGTAVTANTPSGYTNLNWTVTNTALDAFQKVSDGTETAVTIAHGGSARHIQIRAVLVRGANTSAPINITAEGTGSGGSTYTSPSVTTTVNDCLVLGVSAAQSVTGTVADIPAGTSIVGEWNNGPGSTLAVVSFEQATAGATGAKTWANTAQSKDTGTIAIAPSNDSMPALITTGASSSSSSLSARG